MTPLEMVAMTPLEQFQLCHWQLGHPNMSLSQASFRDVPGGKTKLESESSKIRRSILQLWIRYAKDRSF
jgi:hypothetical protein